MCMLIVIICDELFLYKKKLIVWVNWSAEEVYVTAYFKEAGIDV